MIMGVVHVLNSFFFSLSSSYFVSLSSNYVVNVYRDTINSWVLVIVIPFQMSFHVIIIVSCFKTYWGNLSNYLAIRVEFYFLKNFEGFFI